jgi:hypothetical protein
MIYLVYLAMPLALAIGVTLTLVTDPRVRWRIRSRRPAEQKGIALLRSWLTPEQAKQWAAREEFEVIGCHTGNRYRISCGTRMNVHQFDHTGKSIRQWCFSPEGGLATGDVLLAQKIALETMERRALDLANAQACRP